MEPQALDKASAYLNNLLLARGLLTNGKSINFARPDTEGSGTDSTMARVINLVHDLVLQRDYDSEQRENLAATLRKARSDDAQRLLDLQRMQEKNADLARETAMFESQERALQTSVRRAESQAKELKEQMLKMKHNLDQVRTKCLSDVRKRDVELEKLKGHLANMQRGKKDALGMKINSMNTQATIFPRERGTGQDVISVDWSLEKNSNDLLSALVNEASNENVALRQIMTDTMEILKDLSGLENGDAEDIDIGDDGLGKSGQPSDSKHVKMESRQNSSLVSCDIIAGQMNSILEHCRKILQDPSFVPIEEVQKRDEEIVKLRLGWEKMANRWKEAVSMMSEWRKRMYDDGDHFPHDPLTDLEFGKSIAVFPSGRPVFAEDEELSSILYENSKIDNQASEEEVHDQSSLTERGVSDPADILIDETQAESELDIPPEPSPKRRASGPRRKSCISGKPVRPLQPVDTNTDQPAKRMGHASRARPNFASAVRHLGGPNDDDNENIEFDVGQCSRIPLAKREKEPTMTVSEKLVAAEAEAARVKAIGKPKAVVRKRKQDDPAIATKGLRRRSTLSPEELAGLMGVC